MQDIKDLMSDDNYKKYLEKIKWRFKMVEQYKQIPNEMKAPMMLMSAKYLEVLITFLFFCRYKFGFSTYKIISKSLVRSK